MGRLARIVEMTRAVLKRRNADVHVAQLTVEAGAPGDRTTAEVLQPPGYDGAPLPDDYTALLDLPTVGMGRECAIGFADTKNVGLANPGEVRIYSRDSKGPQAIIQLLADGRVSISAPKGFALEASEGDISFTGDLSVDGKLSVSGDVKLDAALEVGGDAKVSGNITGAEVASATVTLSTHTHSGVVSPPTVGT